MNTQADALADVRGLAGARIWPTPGLGRRGAWSSERRTARAPLRSPMPVLVFAAILAHNPFSSNVAHLTPGNWSLLEKSPHLWLVNVCRQS